MKGQEKPSLLNRIVTPILFLVGGLSALLWFIYRIYMLVKGSGDDIVLIDKGSYYMLGVGIGMLDLAFVVIWEQWLVKPLTQRVATIFSRLAVAGVVFLLALPHAIHYVAGEYLEDNGYSVCEKASHQWLFVRDIVYIQDSVECSAKLKEK
jgi:hypothetical protein